MPNGEVTPVAIDDRQLAAALIAAADEPRQLRAGLRVLGEYVTGIPDKTKVDESVAASQWWLD